MHLEAIDATPTHCQPGAAPNPIYNSVVSGVRTMATRWASRPLTAVSCSSSAIPPIHWSIGCVGWRRAGCMSTRRARGDLVVLLGGRTGRDGLHGATFSSIELTDETGKTSGGAVQIGNPIVERWCWTLSPSGDQELYTAITDCGAGGLSSAVSEMGEKVGYESNSIWFP